MNQMNQRERRRGPRASYPVRQRPRLFVGDRLLEVIDLSERGLKVRQSFAFGTRLETGACVFGTLVFFGRAPIRITGWVVRACGDEAALRLHCGVPSTVVAEECVEHAEQFASTRLPNAMCLSACV